MYTTVCTIGFVPSPGLPAFVGVPSYTVPEQSGPATVYISIIAGSIESPRTVLISFSTSDNSATGIVALQLVLLKVVLTQLSCLGGGVDYSGVVMSLMFSSSVTQLPVDIPITNDFLMEVPDERFQVSLATNDGDVNLDQAIGFVTIIDDDRKAVCSLQISSCPFTNR